MLVHVITDNHLHIRSREELASEVESSVQAALRRFAPQITRVEVHLSDENAQKGGGKDKKCTVEARVAGLQAIAATNIGASLDQAIHGALEKLVAQLEHKLGRLSERKGRAPMGDEPAD